MRRGGGSGIRLLKNGLGLSTPLGAREIPEARLAKEPP
jgi:hypothetical protein